MSDINMKTKLKTFNERVTISEAEDIVDAILDQNPHPECPMLDWICTLALNFVFHNPNSRGLASTTNFGLNTKKAAN